MARSSTTVKPGQQLALKHGAFSASRRLNLQNEVIEEARRRMKEGKLTPLEQDCYELLALTKARLHEVSTWLNTNGGALTPRGKLRETTRYELDLIKTAENQALQLWKMLLVVPTEQQLDVDEARSYLSQYGTSGRPDASTAISPPASAEGPKARPAESVSSTVPDAGIGLS